MKLSDIKTLFINLDQKIQLIIIGFIVGVVSGAASLLLNFSLEFLSELIEENIKTNFIFVFPIMGLILSVFFLKTIFKDNRGHGVPEVIYSVRAEGGKLRLRSSISHLLASLFTISFGGSAGPEAPVVISGASIGSNISNFFQANERLRISTAASGAAGAIAAIFNAPIAGIIFSLEVILGEWSILSMLPVAISSITATVISRLFNGNQIPFKHRGIIVNINDIFASAFFSVFIVFFALIFVKSLKIYPNLLSKYIKKAYLKAIIGGSIVSLIVFYLPQVKGEGYNLIREIISKNYHNSFYLILLILLLKILATSVTLGSGGAGGVFAPSLVIGSLTGLLFYSLLTYIFPQTSFYGASLFALVGMSGMLSATLHSPLTGIFLIVEITGGYDVIIPLIIVSFLSSVFIKYFEKDSLYLIELSRKGYTFLPRSDERILYNIRVNEIIEKDLVYVKRNDNLDSIALKISNSRRNIYPVVENNKYYGLLNLNDIKALLLNSDIRKTIFVEEVMRTDYPVVSLDDNLLDVLNIFDNTGYWSLPVVENGKFMGLVSKATILDLYRKELKAQTDIF